MPDQENSDFVSILDDEMSTQIPSPEQAPLAQCNFDGALLTEIKEEVAGLSDLFVRRLNDDKQKSGLIKTLSDGASFAFVEPFIYDIVLLLDRLEKSDDDFVNSVREELYDIIYRRGAKRIKVGAEFNPALFKVVRVTEDAKESEIKVTGIVRNGYIFSGKVIRPAEVVVVRPPLSGMSEADEKTTLG